MYEDDEYEEDYGQCPHCSAEYQDEEGYADHAGDCPDNPYGYNHPDFIKNIAELEYIEYKCPNCNHEFIGRVAEEPRCELCDAEIY